MDLNLNTIQTFSGFKTTDGQVHEDRQAAILHQADIDILSNLEVLVDDKCWSGMNRSDVMDFIKDNINDINKIFDIKNTYIMGNRD